MFSHPVNVAFISCAIGKWMNIDRTELINLVCTGLLHDIGKAKIRDSILNKPGTLLAAEMEIMKTHPAIGYKLLESLGSLETDILLGVLSHHERQDGSGYPNGLKGKQISIFARIVAVADVFSAITSTKAYKMKTSFFKAVEEIQENSFGYLDPQICQIFMNHILNYYCGSQVRLSNELVGVIVYINPTEKTKPVVRCENSFFNLTKERHLEIVDILS
jgi:HD-GYP domain-containing protein (c-di-GMP phosphodiesterase class II)